MITHSIFLCYGDLLVKCCIFEGAKSEFEGGQNVTSHMLSVTNMMRSFAPYQLINEWSYPDQRGLVDAARNIQLETILASILQYMSLTAHICTFSWTVSFEQKQAWKVVW